MKTYFMAGQIWLSKFQSIYSQIIRTPVVGCFNCAVCALLTQCNNPVQDLGMSPAITLCCGHKYQIGEKWREICKLRETAMVKRFMGNNFFYNEHYRLPQELQNGGFVQIQSEKGSYRVGGRKHRRIRRHYVTCKTVFWWIETMEPFYETPVFSIRFLQLLTNTSFYPGSGSLDFTAPQLKTGLR